MPTGEHGSSPACRHAGCHPNMVQWSMGLSGDDPTQTMDALDAEAATPSSAGRNTSAGVR